MRLRLKMNTAESAPARIEGNTALSRLSTQTVRIKLLMTPSSGEKAALVDMGLNIDLEDADNPGF